MRADDLNEFYRVLAKGASEIAKDDKSEVATKLHNILRAQWKEYPARDYDNFAAYFSSTKRAEAPAPETGVLARDSNVPEKTATPLETPAHREESPTPGVGVLEQRSDLAERIATLLEVPAPFAFVKRREWAEIEQLRQVRDCQYFAGRVLCVLEASDGEVKSMEKGRALHEVLKDWEGYPAKQFSYDALRGGSLDLKSRIVGRLVEDLLADKLNRKNIKEIEDITGHAPPTSKDVLTGLALSGGGIRSATFNLGILQGLARAGLLPCFDYLSTVSGGGYIGSWLVAWLKPKGFAEVNPQLSPDWNQHGQKEPPELEFLRSYSNYLTPQLGLLSADSWSLAATYVRNLLLNLTILVLAITSVLLLPRLLVSLSQWKKPLLYLALGLGMMLLALVYTGRNLALFTPKRKKRFPDFSEQSAIQWRIAIPTVLSSWFLSCWLWNQGRPQHWHWWIWMLAGSVISFLIWLGAWMISLGYESKNSPHAKPPKNLSWGRLVAYAPVAGAVGGLLFCAVAKLFALWSYDRYPGREIHFVGWGTGFVAAIFGVIVAIHIGFMGTDFPDERREWWSRAGALITVYTLGWVAIFGFALYSPLVVQWAGHWISGAVTLGWLAHTITGALGARSAKTNGSGTANTTGLLIKTAPAAFVVGLLALLSFGIYRALPLCDPPLPKLLATYVDISSEDHQQDKSIAVSRSVKGHTSFHDQAEVYWPSVIKSPSAREILGLILLCAALALLLSARVDINEFSIHLLYRNRLVRCYLGASHQGERSKSKQDEGDRQSRNPNPFTGFDPDDDMPLADLRQSEPTGNERQYVGPYPILNTTLNVTHGKRLAWQERKAESFIFTPLYSGFDSKPVQGPETESADRRREKEIEQDGAYRPTQCFMNPDENGPSLGTAMGISGAAASPNMGYHSSSSLAVLMTILDLRLGWWAGNPRYKRSRESRSRRFDPPWMRRGPRLGILYMLLELFGFSDDERRYVYLSDGGHFENLGIYELVRRECRLIVACDASADENYRFEDLGNAIRKCRIDLGVDISIPIEQLQPKENKDDGTKWSPQHWAVGIIHYEKLDASKEPGLLIYLKASLTGGEPTDVLEYKNRHPAFPHDTTADQFFTESQFESYRKLGERLLAGCAETDLLTLVCKPSTWESCDPQELEKKVSKYNKTQEKEVSGAAQPT